MKSEQIMHKKATNFIKRTLGLSVLSVAFFGIQSVKAECWEEAAAMYGHDPYLLKAIGWKESRGHVGAVGSLL